MESAYCSPHDSGMLSACAGIDVPAVIAPPGRTRATARMRQQGNSLSRPSSVHVDDFQRSVGAKESPAHRSSGPGRSGGPGSSGQRERRHGSSPAGGPSLQKLLSDPAVVAVRSAFLILCRVCLCTSVHLRILPAQCITCARRVAGRCHN